MALITFEEKSSVRQFCFTFLFILLLAACVSPDKRKSEDVRIAVLKGPSAMSMAGFMQKEFSSEEKKAVITIFDEPAQVQALMIRGETDIALIPGNMAAILYNKGIRYRLLAVPVWGTLFLAGEDTTIKSWDDLHGKTVYLMARGATPDIVFRKLLEMHALEPGKDVFLDYTFPNHLELYTAIAAGRAPLGIIAEPFLSQSEIANRKIHVTFDLETEWNKVFADSVPMMQTAMVVRDSFCLTQFSWLKSFMQAYKSEAEWLIANPDSAGKLWVRYGIIQDTAAAALAVNRLGISVKLAGDEEKGINRFLETVHTFNPDAIGGKMPDSNFVFHFPTR